MTTPTKTPGTQNPRQSENKPETTDAVSVTVLNPTKTMLVTTHEAKSATRITNLYTIRKSKTGNKKHITNIGTFLNIAANYVDIHLRHDNSLETEPWYNLW